MLEEKNIKKIEEFDIEDPEQLELDEGIDNALVPLNLEQNEQQIISRIIEAPTKQELEAEFDAFNIAQSKKNAIRIMKLESLLDKVEDQAIERLENHPNQVSNKELLEYMQVISAQIDRSQKSVDSLKDRQMITPISKNDITINVNTGLETKQSKENVVNAVQALLKQLQNPNLSKPIETTPITVSTPSNNIILEDDYDELDQNNCIIDKSNEIQEEKGEYND